MDDKILALGEHFALAAIDGNEWLPALRAMAEMTGSTYGQLVGFVPGDVPFNWIMILIRMRLHTLSNMSAVIPISTSVSGHP